MLVGRGRLADFRRIGTDDHQVLLLLDRIGDRALELASTSVRRLPFGCIAVTAANAATSREANRGTSMAEILDAGLF